ncbi:MAG: hypothetical protein AB2689_22730 [Candidatus Thiodiazotropha taylori]
MNDGNQRNDTKWPDWLANEIAESKTNLWCYEKTNNPLYLWEKYTECRNVGAPIPEWILEYFDQCAKNLEILWQNAEDNISPKDPAKAIAKAFGMVSHGRGSVFTETSRRRQEIAVHMKLCLGDDPKLKPDQLYDDIAKIYGVHRSTVQRAWAEWGGEWE